MLVRKIQRPKIFNWKKKMITKTKNKKKKKTPPVSRDEIMISARAFSMNQYTLREGVAYQCQSML